MAALSPAAATHVRTRRRFFMLIAALMLLVIALGFGPSFYLRPWFKSTPLPAHLLVHGIVMSAWFALFLVQALMVRTRRIEVHRRLGWAGVALAGAVILTGIQVNLELIPGALARGAISRPEDGVGFALGSMSSLLPFAVLVGLAVGWRRRPGVHKRLMFWAFAWMLGPALASSRPLGQALDQLVAPHLPFFPFDLIWLLALMAYDWKTERRIHAAT